MSKPIDLTAINRLLENQEAFDKLMTLLDRIQFDAGPDVLRLKNGKASIDLHADGTIRLKGRRLVQDAEENIAMTAAWIDLN